MDSRHEAGVAILMSNEAKQALTEWDSGNERIIRARIQTKFFRRIVLQCYAPNKQKPYEKEMLFMICYRI